MDNSPSGDLRHGLAEANGRYTGFTDADYKTEISALVDLALFPASEPNPAHLAINISTNLLSLSRWCWKQLLLSVVLEAVVVAGGVGCSCCFRT